MKDEVRCDKCGAIQEDLAEELRELRSDQEDWRNGVGFIASCLGDFEPKDLSCVRLGQKALRMRAAVGELDDLILRVRNRCGDMIEELVKNLEYVREYNNFLLGLYTEEEFAKVAEKYAEPWDADITDPVDKARALLGWLATECRPKKGANDVHIPVPVVQG
jgi:hypothetical protein